MEYKVLIAGDYHAFAVSGIKVFKDKKDYLLIDYTSVGGERGSRRTSMIDSVALVKEQSHWKDLFGAIKETTPDVLAVTPELMNEKLATFCLDFEIDLVVVSVGSVGGKRTVWAMNLMDKLKTIKIKEPV